MKNLLVLCFVAVFAVIGCKNPTEKQAAVTTTTPAPPPPPAPVDTAKPILAGGSTVHCYQFVDKSKDAHSCQISTRATPNPFVSGYFDWAPFEKDGGHGVLKNGVIKDGMLTADFIYMIEGNVQSEEVYFKMDGDKLTKMRTELVEKKGKLVAKDLKKLKPEIVLTTVDCSKLDKTIAGIKAYEDKLK